MARSEPRAVRPRAPGDAPHEVNLPGYRHADDGTLCRTAVRTGHADPVCSCTPCGRCGRSDHTAATHEPLTAPARVLPTTTKEDTND